MRVLLILLYISLIFFLFYWGYSLLFAKRSVTNDINQEKLFKLVQEYRRGHGLRTFERSSILCDFAAIRVHQIDSNFSHEGFQELSNKFLHAAQFTGIGENLATGFTSAGEVLQGWIKSPLHKANLDRDFTHLCIVINYSNVVAIFGFKE